MGYTFRSYVFVNLLAVFLASCDSSDNATVVKESAPESKTIKHEYSTLQKGMNFLLMQDMIGDNWNYEGENWIAIDSSGEVFGGYRLLEDHTNGIYKRYGRDQFSGSFSIIDDDHLLLKYQFKGKQHEYKCRYFITKDFLGYDQFEIQRVDDFDKLIKDPRNHYTGGIDPKNNTRVYGNRIESYF